MAVPTITPYTGAVPDKATMSKIVFANSINPYLNYINTSFVGQFYTSITELNSAITVINQSIIDAQTAQGLAETAQGLAEDARDSAQGYAQDASNTVALLPMGSIGDIAPSLTKSYSSSKVVELLSDKQDDLISGTTIKTINGTSLLGSGDVVIESQYEKLEEITISAGVASIEFTSFALGHKTFKIVAENVTTSHAVAVSLQFRKNGVLAVTLNSYLLESPTPANQNVTISGSGNSTSILLGDPPYTSQTNYNLDIFGPSNSSNYPTISGICVGQNGLKRITAHMSNATYPGLTTGIKLFVSSGTINTGKFQLWGAL